MHLIWQHSPEIPFLFQSCSPRCHSTASQSAPSPWARKWDRFSSLTRLFPLMVRRITAVYTFDWRFPEYQLKYHSAEQLGFLYSVVVDVVFIGLSVGSKGMGFVEDDVSQGASIIISYLDIKLLKPEFYALELFFNDCGLAIPI